MMDPDRGISSMSEGMSEGTKIPGQLMSEERKNKKDKSTDSPIIFTENDHFMHFSGEIEPGFRIFPDGHNSSS